LKLIKIVYSNYLKTFLLTLHKKKHLGSIYIFLDEIASMNPKSINTHLNCVISSIVGPMILPLRNPLYLDEYTATISPIFGIANFKFSPKDKKI